MEKLILIPKRGDNIGFSFYLLIYIIINNHFLNFENKNKSDKSQILYKQYTTYK